MKALLIFTLALTILLLVSGMHSSLREDIDYLERIEQGRNITAVSTITRSLEVMEAALHEGLVMSDPTSFTAAATDIVAATAAAKASFDMLEQTDDVYNFSKYIMQSGDYAASLAEEVARTGSLPDGAKENMTELLRVTELAVASLTQSETAVGENAINHVNSIATYTDIYYDGASSAHMLSPPVYEGIYGLPEVTAEQAKAIAADFLGVTPSELTGGDIWGGSLPVYSFNMGDVAIDISTVGGKVVRMSNGRALSAMTTTPETARENAALFAESKGFLGMVETEHRTASGITSVTLCYEENETLYYPDQITIQVALDGGDIVGFDATEYHMSHTETRLATSPTLTLDDLSAYTPTDHTLSSSRYAVIESDGGIEKHAIELAINSGDRNYLYYIDSTHGGELSLSRLFEGDDGKHID